MGGPHSSEPNIRDQAYELAYEIACGKLASMDIEELCLKAGVQRADSNKIIVDYLNRPYIVTLTNVEISLKDSEDQVPLKDKIIILHYLTLAKGTPLTGRFITFKQLPGCDSYFSVFHQIAIKPLLDNFGNEPDLLVAAAAKLGGYKAAYGDASVTINAFKYVPITFALWRGDDEFAPRGSIMFDSTISDYLSSEDIRDICATISWGLVRSNPSPH